ncbi:MAG: D-aminoacylase [Gemmatimonadota bacterium]|nr:MAG: D-aminoacylase [Gemmatimonadota bacterium]
MRTKGALFAATVLMHVLIAGSVHAQYDLIIRGARMLDGMGNPWRYADVAVSGGTIAAVGDLSTSTADRAIDAVGLYLAPGFIDVHTHDGPGLATPELSHARPLLAQGITTVFINPDGGGPTDLVVQQERLVEHGLGVNVAQLVSHGSVRRDVIGMADRAPTADELREMRDIVRRGMEAGAFGLSSGLYYAPGSFAETEEVIELAKVVSEFGGVYQSHIRDEADYNIGVVAAVDEVIDIAREARVKGIVTHIKALGPRVWGYSQALVQRIDRAREAGIEVYADQYPYAASGTSITGALVPRWAQVGGGDGLIARLDSAETLARLKADVLENLDRRGGAARLQFQLHRADSSIEGRTMQEVADERGLEPVDLVVELLRAGGASLVSFNMLESDIATLMRQPWTMTSSDGSITHLGRGVPHPRWYGTFPRKIRKYVIEDGVIDLETAIRSMTSLSAGVMGLPDRGVIRAGAVADLVVFDFQRLRDVATFQDPHHYSEGVVYVVVNGELAIDGEKFTDVMSGRVLVRGERGAGSGG